MNVDWHQKLPSVPSRLALFWVLILANLPHWMGLLDVRSRDSWGSTGGRPTTTTTDRPVDARRPLKSHSLVHPPRQLVVLLLLLFQLAGRSRGEKGIISKTQHPMPCTANAPYDRKMLHRMASVARRKMRRSCLRFIN
uniref:Uncharacterized protein n=1 Tax=Anopheles culicifacies TaxID=139723 RepID=A0A182MH05_9DIPT